ncbi:retrovirus-related pol polyprotein from transposon TNT 1-94 [Tanacetum coccineum]
MVVRELKERTEGTKEETGDGLYVRGRRSSEERDCPMKKSSGFVKKGKRGQDSDSSDDEGNTYFGEALVVVGNDEITEFRAIWKVRVQMKDGSSFVLENVCYIPEMKRNLISLGTLDRDGYTVKLQNGRIKVIKGSLMVLSGNMKGNCVCSLDGWAELSEASVGKLEFYENCVLGKSIRMSFGRSRHMTEGVIDYVYADLWGPSQVELMSGCRYFLSTVDDYSRRVWVHFLRHKNKAFSKFKEWKPMVENQTDSFWAEATVTTSYLINRSLSTTLEKKTPMDLWSGHLANYEMLRIFGYVAYLYMNQGKLKLKAIKYIFLRFNESFMYKDTLKGAGPADFGKKVEFEVELEGSGVEPTMDPHTGENPIY